MNSDPTVADLDSPEPGVNVSWYIESTGGTPLLPNQELDYPVYWAEISPDEDRLSVEIVYNEGAPGLDEEDYQDFSISSAATINDLQLTSTGTITWYNSPTSDTPLSLTDLLVNGQTYYAQQDNEVCRFPVYVFVGVLPPIADQWQDFCETEAPTVNDLEIENPESIIWYTSETGSATYSSTDLLVDGGTYYAARVDGSEISEERTKVEVTIYNSEPPIVFNSTQTFHLDEDARISNLVAIGSNILWYPSAQGGIAYRESDPLVDGATYYAEQGSGLCESVQRAQVTVSIIEDEAITLIGCEKFRPQPGDRYVISGWVREDGLQVSSSETRNFSEVSSVFVDLLNHLKDKISSDLPSERHIPDVYVPLPETREFDVLVPYIKDAVSKNLTIYNFAFEKERQTSDGPERVIGFSFSLNDSNTYRFVYKTPNVRKREGSSSTNILNFRYPLIGNSITLNFKNATVCGNKFCINSDFSINDDNGDSVNYSYNENNALSQSITNSGMNSSVEFFTYVPDPDYQSMTYANTLLRLIYKDAEGNEIPLGVNEVEFTTEGSVIDGWQRISTDFTIPIEATNMTISLENNAQGNINAYFDDLRFHPYDANMKSFVYDPVTQRLQAELDENNYATFYEYDTEGGLVRVKKETERGVYTIQETRSGNSKLNNASLDE